MITLQKQPLQGDPHQPRAQLKVGGSLIRVQLPGRSPITAEPEIRHRSRMSFHGFGRLESYEYGRFQHRVEAVILRECIEERGRKGVENAPTWKELVSLGSPETQPYLSDEDPGFVVARLEIEEHPRITKHRLRSTWGAWLRAVDSTSALIGDVLDRMEGEDAGNEATDRLDGSLFHIRTVAVHPAFRGQAIGRRLIAHTLWTMHRGYGDVAMILLFPGFNPLDPSASQPDQSASAVRKLCRYYQKLGFRRSVAGRALGHEAVPMHVFFGMEPLHVSGLNEIGVVE